MPRFAFRLATAVLALLIGLLADHAIHQRRTQRLERSKTAAAAANHSVAQRTDSTSGPISREHTTDSLAHTLAALRGTRPFDADSDVPPAARPLITSLKHQLRDLIAETINAPSSQSQSAESLRCALWNELATRGIKVEHSKNGAITEDDSDNSSSFGEVVDVQVQRPTGHDDLVTVTTTLAIPCGNDASLYIFQRKDNKWILVLAQEANEYENISGALGSFDYAISPADTKGNFFVVTVNVNPWCSSNWQAIRYSAMQISSTAYQPRILAAGEETIYLGVNSPVYRLEVAKKWFSITFEGNSSDADVWNGINSREHVLKYSIKEERVSRVSG